jgi:hypothetical protein
MCLHPPNHQHRNPGTCQWLPLRIAHHRPTNQRSELAISLRRTQLRRQSLNDFETVKCGGRGGQAFNIVGEEPAPVSYSTISVGEIRFQI